MSGMEVFESEDVTWGKPAKGSYKGNMSFLSVFYGGEEYELYDIVYLNDTSAPEPHIGKIIALWEDEESKNKRMLIQWFFRSKDLISLDLKLNARELFLAFGEGKGAKNENDVEVIIRRCKVLCSSKDPRNMQPCEKDITNADYIFCKVYDVERRCICDVDEVAEKIGYDVVFNKEAWISTGIKEHGKVNNSNKASVQSEDSFVPSASLTETDKAPDVAKISKESELFEAVDDGITGGKTKPVVIASKLRKSPAGSSSPGLKKKTKDSNVITGATKKKLDDESQSLKKKNGLAGVKRPSESQEEGKDATKLKAAENMKTLALKGKLESTDVKMLNVPEKTAPAIQDTKDLKKPKLETKNLTPKGILTKPATTSLPVGDGSVVIIKQENEQQQVKRTAQDDIGDRSNSNEAKKLDVDENIKMSSMEGALLDVAAKSHVDTERSKLVPLEAKRDLKSNDASIKSPTEMQKIGESSLKPSKAVDRSDNLSVASSQTKFQSETAKTADQKEGKQEQKQTTKVAMPVSRTKEGVTEGSKKGDNKLNVSKSSDISITKKLEHKKRIVEHESNVEESKFTKRVKLSLDAAEDKPQKPSEPLLSKDHVDSSAVKRVSISKDIESKASDRSDFLKSREEKASEKNSIPVLSTERRRIFKQLPWEEKLLQGLPQGRVLRVFNINPFFTSTDACELLKSVFAGCSDVRMIPHIDVSPYGEALAIFDNRNHAESALRDIEEKCLALTGSNRPLIASLAKPAETSTVTRFPGHIQTEKFKHMQSKQMQSEDMRKAVSTSHCSQPNTIEFEMAMEWRLHQDIAEKCWNELYEKQAGEVSKTLEKFKLNKSTARV